MKVSASGWPSCTSLLVTSKVPTAGSNEYGSGVGGRSRDTFTLLSSPDRDGPESILYRPEQQNPSPRPRRVRYESAVRSAPGLARHPGPDEIADARREPARRR